VCCAPNEQSLLKQTVLVGTQMILGTLAAVPADGGGLATEVIEIKYAAASGLADFLSAGPSDGRSESWDRLREESASAEAEIVERPPAPALLAPANIPLFN
jgi:hypothetical protein